MIQENEMDMPQSMIALLGYLQQNGGTITNLSRSHVEIGVSYTHLTKVVHAAKDAGLLQFDRIPDGVGRPVRITITRRFHVLTNA
jgi:hypothetical protein